ncbi:hypothetical protein ACFQU3_19245 [Terrabacter sp. GCM10028922]|uniref:hypothetical protein n=1 Tax=Terrabacter sp. GCM10028922 TaxID=3273428 RepID=UPI00361D8255
MTGIRLPFHLDPDDRDAICRAALTVTRHRLADVTMDLQPLDEAWSEEAEWAAHEAQERYRPPLRLLTRRPKRDRHPTIDLDPRDDSDFRVAWALAPYTWTTAIDRDQLVVLDTELAVLIWVTSSEYVDLVAEVATVGGDTELLVPDPTLKPWRS